MNARQFVSPPKVQLRPGREWAVARGEFEIRRFPIHELQAAMTYARGMNSQGVADL
ncbi:hypothetical protein [Hoyosella altamirensis]|uniref:Uncharacterized protein n=1 Tax=Hoyosella altamirensis TaxID=616997 RepID=A0A839RUD6_9ACTN|nr:hypothetical protein [Hoyosella altamirensis]MBB3039421.1 hypothetical protein [Hoyosella altamirensis]MBB3039993.1 hypothetical protein [Hoyosella altamirensis]